MDIDYACTGKTRTTLRAIVKKNLFCRQYFSDKHEKSTCKTVRLGYREYLDIGSESGC